MAIIRKCENKKCKNNDNYMNLCNLDHVGISENGTCVDYEEEETSKTKESRNIK
jgi:hypothetical protein